MRRNVPRAEEPVLSRAADHRPHRGLDGGAIHAVHGADPYSSWQRGSNENANGLLREFFPKGTDFAQVAHDELADALAKINRRPRKCLDWKTAHEAFAEEVLRLI